MVQGQLYIYAPISGMPHLAYLHGMDVGERRKTCRQNVLQGVGTYPGLSQSTQMAYRFSFVVLNVFGKFFVNSANTHYLSHTVHDKEIWGICREMVCRFVPHVFGLVPLGYMSILLLLPTESQVM